MLGHAAAPWLWHRFAPLPEFEAIPGLPGFRRIAGGGVSGGGNAALIGLDGQGAPVTGSPCDGLFPERIPSGAVPVAYFSDARCVFCRTMSPMLEHMAESGGIAVAWHELPLLSPTSRVEARASLAAGSQGAHLVFHQRLMGTPFLPTETYLRALANDAGIDPDRLIADMSGPLVEERLARTAALARMFGFFGTPGLVIGRTVVLGQMTEGMLERIVSAERDDPEPGPCR